MPLNPTYSVGTVSVSAGDSIVTGTGTLWVAGGIREGDVFERQGLSITVLSVESNTQLRLAKPWPGVTGSGAYELRFTPDASRVMGATRQAIEVFEGLSPRVDDAVERATAAEAASSPFASYADALAAAPGLFTRLRRLTAVISGQLIEWVRQTDGPCLGGGWAPSGVEITPDHMGMTGGEADAAPAFQAMLDWCAPDFNRQIVDKFIGSRTFLTQLVAVGNVNWDAGVATYYQNHNGRFLSATGNESPTVVPLAANYAIGTKSLSVSLPSIPKQGDWLRIVSDALNPNDRSRLGQATKYRVQEFVQVGKGSTSSSVVLERPLRFTEGTTLDEASMVPSYTLAMNCRAALFDASERFLFKGGRIEQTNGRVGLVHCMVIQSYFKPRVEETVFHKMFGSALFFTGTLYANVTACTFGDIADNELEPNQQGYGVCDGGDYTIVQDCTFGKCRHAYSSLRSALEDNTHLIFAGGNTVGSKVVNCTAVGCTSRAFDTHHGSVGVSFINCTAEGGLSSGFGGRGIDHVVRGCRTVMSAQGFETLVEATGNAFNAERYATSYLVEDCDFQALGDAFYARGSRVTVWDTTFRSRSLNIFRVVNSLVQIEGLVEVIASTERNALPLVTPASDRWPVAVLTGTVSFGGRSELLISKGATFSVDVSAFPSIPVSIFAIDLDKRLKHFGKLKVAAPAGSTLFNQTENRIVCGPTAELEVVMPASNLSLGTAIGKFPVAYTSDATPYP